MLCEITITVGAFAGILYCSIRLVNWIDHKNMQRRERKKYKELDDIFK